MDAGWQVAGSWYAGVADGTGGVWLLETEGPKRRRLTTAERPENTPNPPPIDVSPAFSADGRRMAFIRETTPWINAIYVLSLSPELKPVGPAVRVVGNPRSGVLGVAWTPDNRGLVFASGKPLGTSRLHRIALAPGTSIPLGPSELLPFGEQATAVSVARTGRVVYSSQFRDTDFRRLSLAQPADGPQDSGIAGSTFDEHTPDYSPDGRQLAFASTRSETEEIWISNADGSSPRQMTHMGGSKCANPQWSPDGHTILFNARAEGSSDPYLLYPAGGKVDRLTSDPLEELEARWSRDGQWIYFGSNRSGRYEVWRMPAVGGESGHQITRSGGVAASESPDGRYLYCAKRPASPTAIWRVPVSGGEETLVVDGLSYSLNFAMTDRGLYFVSAGETRHSASIDFFDFTTRRRTTLAAIGKPWWFGVALSRDKQWLLYSIIDRAGSNLMQVDGLQ